MDQIEQEIQAKGLPPHQQRVLDEKAELDDKLRKLLTFHGTDTFAGLDPAEQDRLIRQANAMEDYSGILRERIKVFSSAVWRA